MRALVVVSLALLAAFGVPAGVRTPENDQRIAIEKPTPAMQEAVSKVAEAMRPASMVDRMLWAEVWTKCAKAVEADATDDTIVWGDTQRLRQFSATALRISWRRIGGNGPGKYAGLKEAVEAAFDSVLSKRVQPVDAELRKKYVALCRAVAWAGIGADQ